jgi:hypothetical protein
LFYRIVIAASFCGAAFCHHALAHGDDLCVSAFHSADSDLFQPHLATETPVQILEKLSREPRVMALQSICCVDLGATSFLHLPWLAQEFPKSGIH